MLRRLRLRHILTRTDYLISLLLLLVAGLLVAPAVSSFRAHDAPAAAASFESRLALISEQARRDKCTYTVTLVPHTARIRVTKWQPNRGEPVTHAQQVDALSTPLPPKVIVLRTTLPFNTLTISENGFLLSAGEIVLRADDGSRATVRIAEAQ